MKAIKSNKNKVIEGFFFSGTDSADNLYESVKLRTPLAFALL